MKYKVVISKQAEIDIQHLYQRAHENVPITAPRWYAKLGQAIQSLQDIPERCPLSPQGDSYSIPVRQLIFGKRHGAIRILFAIQDMRVTIVHCVRGASEQLSRDDFAF